ncbi:Thiolase-like protein [Pseudocohnilembus persalinus]|uniref:acetyl-CoA C-acyltransferase n=1 Tax=Pseudocohnilembus persalinus TaxID=266149 RepID=A0A0V0R3U4_PSEPJ|nr:Thiolase-like protein [Pseudocohnilembus persalinus]|eukprot:KRX09163.1 Thiolase-like protein [Pseudocohnilembus persalinus]
MKRLDALSQQFRPDVLQKSADDVVIVSAVRTPLQKAKRGLFKDTKPDTLLSTALKAVVERVGIDKKHVQDIVAGNNLQGGAGEIPLRMASFLAGFPDTTSCVAINRLCSSGLEACAIIAAKIKAGQIDIGIGSGVESMSLGDMNSSVDPEKISDAVFEHEQARNCLMGMGQTSENVAEKYGITRKAQDTMAVESHLKAAQAQKNGWFKDEIVPVKTTILDKEGNEKEITVTEDNGVRAETTLEGLAKLKPAFKKDGTTTAGNSSQVTDGAAAVLLMRRSVAEQLGLKPIGKFVTYAVEGCPPELMGVGPAVAIPKALNQAGLKISDIGVYEINEAFASQATYCVEKLGIDKKKLNPKGGAIALGHPLGCTGARQIATLMPELKRQNQKWGVVSMCIGTGMGAAAVILNEQ